MAKRNLSKQLSRKEVAEDLGNSVLRTVIRRARENKLCIEHSDDFRNFLVGITLNKARKKARKKARYWKAQKRDMSREQPIAEDGPQLADLAVYYRELPTEPMQEEGDVLLNLHEALEGRLNERCRYVLSAKLEGQTHAEIAKELGVSTKAICRYLAKVKSAALEIVREDE